MRWKILKSEKLFQTGFFRFRVDECELPDGRIMPRYYVMEFADWVNVVPITREGKMVLVRQYRHGADREFIEIPGGSTEPGLKEDPQRAGERELLEETGYQSKQWVYCGSHSPNPALQNNRMHTFVAFDCEKTAEPNLDPFEDLYVELVDVEKALKMWVANEFDHSLIAASLGLALKTLSDRGYPLTL
jgi:ADP-ribose pyrophosphatase